LPCEDIIEYSILLAKTAFMTRKTLILAVETSSRVGSVAIAASLQLLDEVTFSGPMKHSAEIFSAIRTLLDRFSRSPEEIEQVYISIGPGSITGLRIAVTLAKAMHLANSVNIIPVDTLDVIAANVINLNSTSDERQATSNERRETSDERQTTSDERRAMSDEIIAPVLDAKRGQFYIAVYQKQTASKNTEKKLNYKPNSAASAISAVKGWSKILPDSLMTVEEFLGRFACKKRPVWLLGDGLLYHKDKFKADGVCFFDEKFWSPRASKVHQLGWQKAQAGKFADPLALIPNYLMRPDITIRKK